MYPEWCDDFWYEDFFSDAYNDYIIEQNFYNTPLDAWEIDPEELRRINDEYERNMCGDIYKREEFGRMIEEGLFIPYDGKGYFHDGTKETNISVWDTSLTPQDVEKYPYVVWYNK